MTKAKYEPYPEYRDSEVAWLRDMPRHWELLKTKRIFNRVQRPMRPEDGVVTAFRDGEVTLRSNRRVDGFTNAVKEIGYQGVRAGDLLVHAMDGFAGAIGVSDSDGKCSPVCSVCVPQREEQLDVTYYGYLVRQLAVTDFITSLAKGIRERSTEFRFSEFSILPLVVPPKAEQTQIAKFLDYETAKIDALIEKQQQLIALLKEKRQAVISHAVTKGLNPDAPMRDSGVERLGEVPAHWEVKRAKHVASVFVPQRNKPVLNDAEGIAWVTMDDMRTEKITQGSVFVSIESARNAGSKTLPAGAVIASCVGNFGVCATNEIDVIINQQLQAYVPWSINAQYLAALVELSVCYFEMIGTAATLVYVNQRGFDEMPVLVPPLDEQQEICDRLAQSKLKIDTAIDRTRDSIALLQERRTALISAAVTGKIDVRGWKAPKSEVEAEAEVA